MHVSKVFNEVVHLIHKKEQISLSITGTTDYNYYFITMHDVGFPKNHITKLRLAYSFCNQIIMLMLPYY